MHKFSRYNHQPGMVTVEMEDGSLARTVHTGEHEGGYRFGQNRQQEIFIRGQHEGVHHVEDDFCHMNGVPAWVMDKEDAAQEAELLKLEKLQKVFDHNAELVQCKLDGMPDGCLHFKETDKAWDERGADYQAKRELGLKASVDHALKPEVEDTGDFFPSHWVDAARYWERICNMLLEDGHKWPDKWLGLLWKKVKKAKDKRSINSWYFYTISFWCAHYTKAEPTKRAMLKYAEKARKSNPEWKAPECAVEPSVRIKHEVRDASYTIEDKIIEDIDRSWCW